MNYNKLRFRNYWLQLHMVIGTLKICILSHPIIFPDDLTFQTRRILNFNAEKFNLNQFFILLINYNTAFSIYICLLIEKDKKGKCTLCV